MNLPFVMSISGSIAFLLYMATKPIVYRGLTAHWQYRFLKVCILFYLVPYQCFQEQYLILCRYLFGYEGKVRSLDNGPLIFEARNTIYITNDGKMYYEYWLPFVICAGIWLCTVAVLLFRQIRKYYACRKGLLMVSQLCSEELKDIVEQYYKAPPVLRKRIRIIHCPFVQTPCTIGAFWPVIVLPRQYRTADLPLYLAHELSHIKNHDILWKFAAFFVVLLHWYNPLVYLLIREVYVVCEKACDETVMTSLDEKQKMHYENLVLEAAQHHTKMDTVFVNTFSSHKKQMKERLLFMTRKNGKASCWKMMAAMVIFIVAVSMPVSVMAYEPVKIYHDIMHDWPVRGDMYIYADDMTNPFLTVQKPLDQLDFSLSDDVILDEYGNQYPINPACTENACSCTHVYVNGTRIHHEKNDRGCTIYTYKLIYCQSCKTPLQETLDNQATYINCPH